MRISVTDKPIIELETDAVMVGVFEGAEDLNDTARELDEAMGGMIRSLIESGDVRGKQRETTVLYPSTGLPWKRLILVGLGKAELLNVDSFRQAMATGAKEAHKRGARRIALAVETKDQGALAPDLASQGATEGIFMGLYPVKNHKTAALESKAVTEVVVSFPAEENLESLEKAVQVGEIFADAVCMARDLVNQPSNHLTPHHLAEVSQAIALKEGMKCTVLEKEEMDRLKMGAFLGVASGSEEPPRFIIMEHNGPKDGDAPSLDKPDLAPIVLVGKGITFDSGGISLKPRDHMEEMKTDMAGAAAIIAAMQGVARLDLPLSVIGLIPTCENLPSGSACKPGDVLLAMNKKSIEVINTDAEGRLILADALCYAARYKPQAVIDVATLTGACVVALGEEVAAGIFSTHDELCSSLIAAGEFHGEKIWRLPLYEEYQEKIKSDVADVKNTGGRYGGVGSSAIFLKAFVSYPWAHIDIAGTALAKSDSPYTPKGGTGFGVRTLLSYLMERAEHVTK